ncbi:peptidylprolyl isomerase [Maritimibacter sp. DP1N21-5]|uniref:peptidylprolyl isomerase n=1 Tax=Maritimibacter sp. DP1N21-5 TaxID=2836867 RepID=UPI001C445F53|nr:peptidylprolyl isomerase [Maritimibacter sp. DP1N21-5]MBV7410109.1 SurA N-terminal domain-containing protein [Maritimibacter sp. DP1N21-5]
MFSNISRFFVWIIMGLVLVGLVGFGSFNFGGSANSIGRVGDTDIDASAYFRELNAEFRAWEAQTGQNITMAQAQTIGLDQQVLSRVITTTALENETARVGISVGDQNLATRVTEIEAFQGPNGAFDRETYNFVLDQSGLTAREFEETMRAEVARTILAGAVTQGVTMPEVYTNTLYAYARETRDFTWAEVTATALETPVPAPSDEEVQAWYDANPEAYTQPETRQITYAWMRPEDVVAQIPVSDEDLRQQYEARLEEFVIPERRLVERLVFADEGAAQSAADRIAAGETNFDDEVEARGLSLGDADLGDVTRGALGAAGEPIFALEEPGVVGPIDTDLGPALFRMNAILAASETTFEEAREGLLTDYTADAARRLVQAKARELDEQLASGATLEELAEAEEGLTVGKIAWYEGMEDGIAAYDGFRSAAADVTQTDFPEVFELSDGSVAAIRLDEIRAPELRPLDDVRDEVVADWRADATASALTARAQELIALFAEGNETPATQGLAEVVEEDMARTAFVAGTPPSLLEEIFAMEVGEWRVISGDGITVMARLDAIAEPDQSSEEARQIKSTFSARMGQTLALDLQDAFATAIEEQTGVTLDQAVINAVHANFP